MKKILKLNFIITFIELFNCNTFPQCRVWLNNALCITSIIIGKIGFVPFATFIHLFHQAFKLF